MPAGTCLEYMHDAEDYPPVINTPRNNRQSEFDLIGFGVTGFDLTGSDLAGFGQFWFGPSRPARPNRPGLGARSSNRFFDGLGDGGVEVIVALIAAQPFGQGA